MTVITFTLTEAGAAIKDPLDLLELELNSIALPEGLGAIDGRQWHRHRVNWYLTTRTNQCVCWEGRAGKPIIQIVATEVK